MTIDELWYGRGNVAQLLRGVIVPLSWLYQAIVSIRNAMYDRGLIRIHESRIPVVSVGNITVGGTGKTPFSAYLVGALLATGHRPAVVMRGYGGDEPRLHQRLNPGIPIVSDPDRVAGIRAAENSLADVVVLDDGFQHRRAGRDLDIVLVSAEQWGESWRMLPAGPLREPRRALRRADLVVVTRKSAAAATASAIAREVGQLTGGGENVAIVELAPDELVSVETGRIVALGDLAGARVLAIAGIGDPSSFFAQLRQLGAIVEERSFPDHHAYSAAEVLRLSTESGDHKYAVTTGKDAVKLAEGWPANGAGLWYLSQAVRPAEGQSLVASALANLFKRATSIAE